MARRLTDAEREARKQAADAAEEQKRLAAEAAKEQRRLLKEQERQRRNAELLLRNEARRREIDREIEAEREQRRLLRERIRQQDGHARKEADEARRRAVVRERLERETEATRLREQMRMEQEAEMNRIARLTDLQRQQEDLEVFNRTALLHDLSECKEVCVFCGAMHWMGEKLSASSLRNPRFSKCCGLGKVMLPKLSGNFPDLRSGWRTTVPEARRLGMTYRSTTMSLPLHPYG